MQRMMADAPRRQGPRTFTLNYPLPGFPEKITLDIDPNAKVINGAYGNRPTKSDVWAQAELLEDRWGGRDGGLTRLDYDKSLEIRYNNFHTPAFSGCIKERPSAAILPLQADSIPQTSEQLSDERVWGRDSPRGRKLMVRKLVSEAPGLAEMVLDAYLAYAKVLFRAGIIDEAVSFTRPRNIAKWLAAKPNLKKAAKGDIVMEYFYQTGDRNILLHLDKGAKLEQIYPDGCPKDPLALGIMIRMSYTHLLA